MKEPAEIKVKSLQKALEVLNCFTEKQPLGVTEISKKLGLYKSNVHNILATFKSMDYLEQDSESDKYYLGDRVFYLCRALGDGLTLTRIAMPYLQEIAKQVNEIVYLAKPHNDEVIYLEALYPLESKRPMHSLMGERLKMYCCSVGKAMLCNLAHDTMMEYIKRPKPALTKYTITDTDKLYHELMLTKERGYAIDNMEQEFGIKCVGVPIFNSKGDLEGGISISGPSLRFEDNRIEELATIIMHYANEIKKKL